MVSTPVDEHPRFRRLADYLAGKAPPGRLPGRQHIEPTEIADLLPWMMMVDVIAEPDGGLRYRIRLVGTEVVAIQGSDGTGKYVEQVLDKDEAASILRGYGTIIRSRQPEYRSGVVATAGREHVPYRRVAFPLARDGARIDMLLFIFANNGKEPSTRNKR
ncbi:MAG: PAS domain-containing protein [Stellaceae bacterium]